MLCSRPQRMRRNLHLRRGRSTFFHLLLTILLILADETAVAEAEECSVLVYGATPAGICAAVAASRRLKSSQARPVCLLTPHGHVGGMVTGGLGATDTGGTRGEALIGGIAREFFEEVGRLYGSKEPVYHFEPSVASKAFSNLLSAEGISVLKGQLIERVHMNNESSETFPRIANVSTRLGMVFAADVFIDATYEGDLMAMAGVSYTFGREGAEEYNETLAGRRVYSPEDQFHVAVNPLNNETGTVLPFVSSQPPGAPGEGDKRVMAYNLRLCLTRSASNKVDIKQPPNYDPSRWELYRRYAQTPLVKSDPKLSHFMLVVDLPNGKTDVNTRGPVSTDFIGASVDYPESNWLARAEIIAMHYAFTHQLLWFLANDPDISEELRNETSEYGLCADEFPVSEWYEFPHWPPQLYVREARRMIGPYVFTQDSASGENSTGRGVNSIGCGAYSFDSHNFQRYPCHLDSINCSKYTHEGEVNPCCQAKGQMHADQDPMVAVINEGGLGTSPGPFEIPYDVLLPDIHEVSNLLVPGAVSASHVGFSCLRLEPQWMIMGHSAGTAAALALEAGLSVQTVSRSALHDALSGEDQVLHTSK